MLITGDGRGQGRKNSAQWVTIFFFKFLFLFFFLINISYMFMFLRHAQPTILTRSSPKQKWPFSAFVGIIWDSFLSHAPRLQRPCRAVAATAGTGLAGLCNLTISILGPPQEMWPKVEGLSSFKPTWMGIITKWADSAVTLKAVWDNTIISCFVFLSSWVI